MHNKLKKLDKEDIICIMDYIIDDMKTSNMTSYLDKYKAIIEDKVYCITKEHAREIVRDMKPYGEVYSMDTVRTMLAANGIDYDEKVCTRYYLTMNMYANDARQVAEENNMPVDKFCFVMAKSFINDVDGGKHKVEKYFMDVVD